MYIVTFANMSHNDDLEQKKSKISAFYKSVKYCHKPSILKELNGIFFRKEGVVLSTANQIYTK